MSQVIIYPQDGGAVAVIYPAEGCGLSVLDIAAKDVPEGVPFLVIDAADVPQDREFRDAWVADFSAPHGYGLSDQAWIDHQEAVGDAA